MAGWNNKSDEMEGWDGEESTKDYKGQPSTTKMYPSDGGYNNNRIGRGAYAIFRGRGGGQRYNNNNGNENGGRDNNTDGGTYNDFNEDQNGNVDDATNTDNNINIKITTEPYKSTIFDFIPHDFKRRTIEELYDKCPQIFRKCNILQKCLLRNYVIKAYKMALERSKKLEESIEGHSRTTTTTTAAKSSTSTSTLSGIEVRPFGGTYQTLPSILEEELEDVQQARSVLKRQTEGGGTSVDLIDLYHSMLQPERSADVLVGDVVQSLSPPSQPFSSNIESLTDFTLEQKQREQEQEELLRPPEPPRIQSMQSLINLNDITQQMVELTSISTLLERDVVDVPQTELPKIIQRRPPHRRSSSDSLFEEHLLRFPLEMRQFHEISSFSGSRNRREGFCSVLIDLKLIENEFLKYKHAGSITMISQSEVFRSQDRSNVGEVSQLKISHTPVLPPSTIADIGTGSLDVAGTTNDKSIGGLADFSPRHANISSLSTTRPGTLKGIEEQLSLRTAPSLPKRAISDDIRQLSESTLKTDLIDAQLITSTPQKAASVEYVSSDVQRPSTISEKTELELTQQEQPRNLIAGTEIPVAEMSDAIVPTNEVMPVTAMPIADIDMVEVMNHEQQQPITKTDAIAPPSTDDDFRKDWFNILRQRKAEVNYEINEYQTKRRKRYHGPRHIQPRSATQLVEQEVQISAAATLPPPPPSPTFLDNRQEEVLSTAVERQQQEDYDQFILSNLESVTQLINNDDLMKDILKGYRDYLHQIKNSEEPIQRYDIEVILNAPKHRLNIKREIIRALICNETFDFSTLTCIKDRMSAAIGFAFLIELKSVGLIKLSNDGQVADYDNGNGSNGDGFLHNRRGGGGGERGGRDRGRGRGRARGRGRGGSAMGGRYNERYSGTDGDGCTYNKGDENWNNNDSNGNTFGGGGNRGRDGGNFADGEGTFGGGNEEGTYGGGDEGTFGGGDEGTFGGDEGTFGGGDEGTFGGGDEGTFGGGDDGTFGGGDEGTFGGGDEGTFGGGDEDTFGGGDEGTFGGGDGAFGGGDYAFGSNKKTTGHSNGAGIINSTVPQKQREFYIPPEPTDNEDEIFSSGISSGINFTRYESIPVQVNGEDPPQPLSSFSSANFRDLVLQNISRSGYKTPTPIQKTAIPVISGGRDLMACAQTGSGKTAAFLIPIINTMLKDNFSVVLGRPHAVIVSPTRELAIQTFNEARKFSFGSHLGVRLVYGGTSTKYQCENITKGGGLHILICTPGRLLDFVDKGFITFEDVRFVVLDEADRMLDMGFKDSVATIMNHPTMPPVAERQNLMFSATFPGEIQRMAGEYLNNYIFIAVGVVGGACADVTQVIYEVQKFKKKNKLMELLRESKGGTIVFVETKRGADFLASLLSELDIPTTSIHGDRLQSQREKALKDFKSGQMRVLIATSVAARGLDIRNVSHVINFDLPSNIDEYVHRIGRTGRVGNKGKASSLFDPERDAPIACDLVRILTGAGQEVPTFLKTFAGGGGDFEVDTFGGHDVRRHVPQSNRNMELKGPPALEEEEDWN